MFRMLTAKVASGFEDRLKTLDKWTDAHLEHLSLGEYAKIVYRFTATEVEVALSIHAASKAAKHDQKLKAMQEVVEFRKNLSSL